jgi:hypothetical protein
VESDLLACGKGQTPDLVQPGGAFRLQPQVFGLLVERGMTAFLIGELRGAILCHLEIGPGKIGCHRVSEPCRVSPKTLYAGAAMAGRQLAISRESSRRLKLPWVPDSTQMSDHRIASWPRMVLVLLAGLFLLSSVGYAGAWNWHALLRFRWLGGIAGGTVTVAWRRHPVRPAGPVSLTDIPGAAAPDVHSLATVAHLKFSVDPALEFPHQRVAQAESRLNFLVK